MDADGTLGAAAAFNVAKATSVTVDAANGGTASIQAAAAKDVNITAGATMDLTGSDFAKAETVTLTQNAGALTGGVAFDAINTLTVSGEGTAEDKASAITVGQLGSDAHGYDINVTATGLAGGFTFGAVNAGEGDVTLDLTEVTGNVKNTTTVDGNNITVNAAQLGTTNLGDITATGDVTIDGMGILGGDATTAALDLGDISIAKDHSAAISFDGSSDVTIGTIGTGTSTDTAGTSVTLDASGYLGAISGSHTTDVDATIGAITAETVTIKGSEIAANVFTTSSAITADNLTFTGGLVDDKVNLTGLTDAATGTTTTMNLSIDTGVGADEVTITATGATHMTGTIANAETVTIAADTDAALDMTGLTITGNTAATTNITGSSGVDTLVAAVGGGTITGGKGADNITLGAGVDTVNVATAGDSTTTNYDHITGFATTATGGDILQLDATAAVWTATAPDGWTVSNGVATKDDATLTDFINDFAKSDSAGVVAFAVTGDSSATTYVLNSDGDVSTTGDVLVELVGVGGTSVTTVSGTAGAFHIIAA